MPGGSYGEAVQDFAMGRRSIVALLIVVLITGCQAPTGEPTATPTGDEVSLDVRFDPPYNVSLVLDRLESIRGLTATEKIVVHEYPRRPSVPVDPPDRFLSIRPAGALTLGLASSGTVTPSQPLGYTLREEGTVHVYVMSRGGLDRYNTSQELVLAHELTHALQYQHGLVANNRDILRTKFRNWTTDTRLTALAIIEGDAVVTTATYRRTYLPNTSSLDLQRTVPPRAGWQTAFQTAPYVAGRTYYESRGAGPELRTEILGDPPNDTRELLHPRVHAREVTLPTESTRIARFERTATDTVGELAIKHALLVNDFETDRARFAAEGWVDGRMSYYRDEDDTVVRWTTVWTDAVEADSFVAAYTTLFERREGTWRDGVMVTPATNTTPRTALAVDRTGNRVVVIAATDPSLVREFRSATNASSRSGSRPTTGATIQLSIGSE
jgi:hypothetical protein